MICWKIFCCVSCVRIGMEWKSRIYIECYCLNWVLVLVRFERCKRSWRVNMSLVVMKVCICCKIVWRIWIWLMNCWMRCFEVFVFLCCVCFWRWNIMGYLVRSVWCIIFGLSGCISKGVNCIEGIKKERVSRLYGWWLLSMIVIWCIMCGLFSFFGRFWKKRGTVIWRVGLWCAKVFGWCFNLMKNWWWVVCCWCV